MFRNGVFSRLVLRGCKRLNYFQDYFISCFLTFAEESFRSYNVGKVLVEKVSVLAL